MSSNRSRSETTMVPGKDRHQLSLMHVFRSAHQSRDSNKEQKDLIDGDRALTERSRERRAGTDEKTLRKHLNQDMASLLNTVNLDATVPLDGYDYVSKSIVNFGFGDLSLVADTVEGPEKIAEHIRKTLLAYEPRLIPGTLEVTVSSDDTAGDARLSFDISAEMVANPVDIPLTFVAEVDKGAGKVQLTKLRVQT